MTKFRAMAEKLFAEVKGYPLSDWVADQRDDGKSWRSIARELESTLDVELTDVTLINWYGERATATVVPS